MTLELEPDGRNDETPVAHAVRAFHEAYNAGDRAGFEQAFSTDVRLDATQRDVVNSGVLAGADAVVALWAFREVLPQISLRVVEAYEGRVAVVNGEISSEDSASTLATTLAIRCDAEGRLAEIVGYAPDSLEAAESRARSWMD